MTGLVIELNEPHDHASIFTDSLGYTISGRHDSLGAIDKVIPFPTRRAVLCGSGIFEIQARAGCELSLRPDLATFEQVVAALPDILRAETETLADIHGITDPGSRMLLDAIYLGLNEATDLFEAVSFGNYTNNYEPRRGHIAGFVAIPNVPPSYVPAGFAAMSREGKGIAALKSVRSFLSDHDEAIHHPGLGGEVVMTEINRDGVHSRVIARFSDHEQTKRDSAATWEAIAAGHTYAGAGLTTAVADRPGKLRELEERLRETGALDHPAPTVSRQQRRAAARRVA